MKKLILSALATTLTLSPLAVTAAQARPVPQRTVITERHGPVTTRTVVRDHRWQKGQRFERRYARNYQVIGNPRAYRLNGAPRGYHWVRSGNDAVLVGITSGLIASVIAGAIR